jgi:hypothetical protein
MSDYFLQLMPANHAIRSMNLAAARASLGNEPTFTCAIGTTANEARLQCAAIAWVMGSSYSLAAVKALPQAARTYLITLFGLPANPRSAAAQAERIDTHRSTHHPQLAVGLHGGGGDVHGGGPGGGPCGGTGGVPEVVPGGGSGGGPGCGPTLVGMRGMLESVRIGWPCGV